MRTADDTRQLIERHWHLANHRDWAGFAQLLHPDLHYSVPQTREYSEGAAAYLDLFCTWPGAWQARIERLVCEPQQAVCYVAFEVDGTVETGISAFELAEDGRILRVTDHWPAPYEPPPRVAVGLRRG